MPSTLSVLAERRDGRVLVHADTVPLAFMLTGLRSADGHDMVVYLQAALKPVRTAADEQLFAEQFLSGREAVMAGDVHRHFIEPLTAEAAAFVAGHPAAAAMLDLDTLDARLARRLEAVGFACGLCLAGPAQVSVDSDTLREERRQGDERQRQLTAVEHAARLSDKLATAGPAWRLAVADQAAVLPALIAAMPPGRVLAAAGPHLLVIEADQSVRVVTLPDAVGPLRSVRDLGGGRIVVGGVKGLALLTTDLTVDRVMPASGAAGRGFNAVAAFGPHGLAATHGELGLAVWDDVTQSGNTNGSPGDGPRLLATPGAARGVLAAGDGRMTLAAGTTVCVSDGRTVRTAFDVGDTITALAPVGDEAIAVHRGDGGVTLLDAATLRPLSTADTGGLADPPATAVVGLTAGGLKALLIGHARGVRCVTTAGESIGRIPMIGGCRMLAVAGGRVAAVGPDRASVHVWDAATSGQTSVAINVLARTGHHVTDIVGTPAEGSSGR